jgi:hypothetical protein
MDMDEGSSAGYDASGMSETSASGMGGKYRVFRASAFSDGVVAYSEGLVWFGFILTLKRA